MTEAKEAGLSGFALDLLYAIAQSQNTNDLRKVAERFCAAHEFSYWVLGLAGPDKALTNYPAALVKAYVKNRWHCGCDPLVNALHRHRRVLSWDLNSLQSADRPMDSMQRRLMDFRWRVGARVGVSALAYERRGNAVDYAIVSFSRDRPLSEIAKRHLEPLVQVLAPYFLSVAQDIFLKPRRKTDAEPVPMTPRERDCLVWAAIGKSSWEIGQVLGISIATVNFHLGNAARKLGVRGRACAVAQAIRFGLINPT